MLQPGAFPQRPRGLHMLDDALQPLNRVDYRASDQQSSREHGQQGDGGDAQLADQLLVENIIHVVDVDARADDPSPRLKSFYKGDFLGGGSFRVVLKRVFDESRAMPANRVDELAPIVAAIGIHGVGHVLADNLGFHRVHDDPRAEIVDPKIILVFRAVAHVFQ